MPLKVRAFLFLAVLGVVHLIADSYAVAQESDSVRPRRLPSGDALLNMVTEVKQGVLQVVAADQANMQVAAGSGFYIDSTRAVVGHQVAVRAVNGRIHLPTGEMIPFSSVASGDPGMNLALLDAKPPSHLDTSKIKVLTLSDEKPNVSDEILAITMPTGREQATVAKGTISGTESVEGIGEVYTLDVPIVPGAAGSPVINHAGEVVGVITFVMQENGAHYFAVPVDRIHRLIKEADDSLPVKLVDYRRVNSDTLVNADGIEAVSADEMKIEATIVEQPDGSVLIDDRYVLKGSGTREDPYRVSWDQLVSAGRVYRPREGKDKLPERVTMLNDKYVRITGYVAFPLMVTESDELLLMLNQWDGCCIGVPPTPYDAVEVTLTQPFDAEGGVNIFNYGTVEGKFKVDPFVVNNWLVGLYLLEDATLKLEM